MSLVNFADLLIEKDEHFEISVKILDTMYKAFNKKYFNNKLGTYPIIVKKLKAVSGRVVSVGIKSDPSSWKIKQLTFSNAISSTKDETMGIVLHEMIHVDLIETERQHPKIHHDRVFKEELKALQQKAPFTIPVSEDITHKNVNFNVVKAKKQVIILTTKKGVYNGIKVFNIKLQDAITKGLKEFPKGWLEAVKPAIVISDDVELQKYPIKRSFGVKGFGGTYQIDPELAQKIADNGELIWKYKGK